MQNCEIWKTIQGYEGYYEVSSLGRVKSLSRMIDGGRGWSTPIKERILKSVLSDNGYQVVLLHNHKQCTKKIHQLVAINFIPNPLNLPQINHIDGDKSNNQVEKLEWCSSRENIRYSWSLGLSSSNHCSGENHHLCKTSGKQVKECIELYATGRYTQRELAKRYNVSVQSVNNWVNQIARRTE